VVPVKAGALRWTELRLRSRRPRDLSPAEVDAIWAFCQTLIDRRREEFEATLRRCERAILVHHGDRVVGLATSMSSEGWVGGRRVRVLEARWAWLAPEVRGLHLPPLFTAWILLDVWLRHPGQPVYGMLIAATEQSFLMLHRYTRRAWPHPDRPTPPDLDQLLRTALPLHVGDAWDPAAGVVRGHHRWSYRVAQRARRDQGELARLADWYHTMNPGQAEGDCLPMILPLDVRNLLQIGWRAATSGRAGSRTPR
jgi:hypothetical protein